MPNHTMLRSRAPVTIAAREYSLDRSKPAASGRISASIAAGGADRTTLVAVLISRHGSAPRTP